MGSPKVVKRGQCVRPTVPSPELRRFRGHVLSKISQTCGQTLGRPIQLPFLLRVIRQGDKMLDLASKVERYRKEANRCGELAKEATPPFLAEIYRKVAVRYVFMAEELLKGRAHDEDAIEKADRMISRPQPDVESLGGYHARGLAPTGTHR